MESQKRKEPALILMTRVRRSLARRSDHRIAGLVTALVLAGCQAASTAPTSTGADDSEPSAATVEPASSTPPPADRSTPPMASSTAPPGAALVIPIAAPCAVTDSATTEEIIGGPIARALEWEPGDQPFGDAFPPSSLYGCQYSLMDSQLSPTFGILIPGQELTADEWDERTADLTDCRDLEVPENLVGESVRAGVCPSAAEGWSLVALTGLFGGTGVRCDVIVENERIDEAYERLVIDECGRIIGELAS